MPANLYPYVVGDEILRTCRHCHSQVAQPSMCLTHTRTCMTCCSSRLKRNCGLTDATYRYDAKGNRWIQSSAPAAEWEDQVIQIDTYGADMTWEEHQAEKAKLNRELGFRDYTEAELAEDAKWRTGCG